MPRVLDVAAEDPWTPPDVEESWLNLAPLSVDEESGLERAPRPKIGRPRPLWPL